ncbi:hypothetical protein ACFQ0B_58010 [Nonomuraea thailandensis]
MLAPMFAQRNLKVRTWSGINLLGGGDGANLARPGANAAKSASKQRVLPETLGYLPQGETRIDYLEDLGDFKTAWDLVTFEGFLGTGMRMEFTWHGCDSALAAPSSWTWPGSRPPPTAPAARGRCRSWRSSSRIRWARCRTGWPASGRRCATSSPTSPPPSARSPPRDPAPWAPTVTPSCHAAPENPFHLGRRGSDTAADEGRHDRRAV